MSQFNSVVSDALALSEDAFRNPELDRSAQLALTLLSQRLANEFPPQFDELITAYEQSDNNRFSLKARTRIRQTGRSPRPAPRLDR